MKSLIGDVKKRFPNHPRVWLKDVQSYFHMKVTLRESDSGWSYLSFPLLYPPLTRSHENNDNDYLRFKGKFSSDLAFATKLARILICFVSINLIKQRDFNIQMVKRGILNIVTG